MRELLLTFLQSVDTAPCPQGGLYAIPPILVALVGALVGAAVGAGLTLMLQKRTARLERQQAARHLVAGSRRVLRRLDQHRGHLDRARSTSLNATIIYFRGPEPLVDNDELRSVEDAVTGAGKLDLACLDAWRGALASVRVAQSLHNDLKRVSGLSGQRAAVDMRADGYRQHVREAQDALRNALLKTKRHADPESLRAIESLQESS